MATAPARLAQVGHGLLQVHARGCGGVRVLPAIALAGVVGLGWGTEVAVALWPPPAKGFPWLPPTPVHPAQLFSAPTIPTLPLLGNIPAPPLDNSALSSCTPRTSQHPILHPLLALTFLHPLISPPTPISILAAPSCIPHSGQHPRPSSPTHAQPRTPTPLSPAPLTHARPCMSPSFPAVSPTLQAEKTPSFSSFFPRGNPRTCALRWLARCCWLSPGRAGSLDPAAPAVPPLAPAAPAVAVPGPGGGRPGCAASGSAMPGPACAPRPLRLRTGNAGICSSGPPRRRRRRSRRRSRCGAPGAGSPQPPSRTAAQLPLAAAAGANRPQRMEARS